MTDGYFVLCWFATGGLVFGAGGFALYTGLNQDAAETAMVIGGFMAASTIVLLLLLF